MQLSIMIPLSCSVIILKFPLPRFLYKMIEDVKTWFASVLNMTEMQNTCHQISCDKNPCRKIRAKWKFCEKKYLQKNHFKNKNTCEQKSLQNKNPCRTKITAEQNHCRTKITAEQKSLQNKIPADWNRINKMFPKWFELWMPTCKF